MTAGLGRGDFVAACGDFNHASRNVGRAAQAPLQPRAGLFNKKIFRRSVLPSAPSESVFKQKAERKLNRSCTGLFERSFVSALRPRFARSKRENAPPYAIRAGLEALPLGDGVTPVTWLPRDALQSWRFATYVPPNGHRGQSPS